MRAKAAGIFRGKTDPALARVLHLFSTILRSRRGKDELKGHRRLRLLQRFVRLATVLNATGSKGD